MSFFFCVRESDCLRGILLGIYHSVSKSSDFFEEVCWTIPWKGIPSLLCLVGWNLGSLWQLKGREADFFSWKSLVLSRNFYMTTLYFRAFDPGKSLIFWRYMPLFGSLQHLKWIYFICLILYLSQIWFQPVPCLRLFAHYLDNFLLNWDQVSSTFSTFSSYDSHSCFKFKNSFAAYFDLFALKARNFLVFQAKKPLDRLFQDCCFQLVHHKDFSS